MTYKPASGLLSQGRHLREVREENGLSQAELAAAMKTQGFSWSQATVWAIERGDRPLRLIEAVLLAQCLPVSLDRLVSGADTEAQDTYAAGFRDGIEAAKRALTTITQPTTRRTV